MKMIKETRLIEKINEDEEIKYWRFRMPLMSDRDMVFRQFRKTLEDGSKLIFVTTIDRPDVPPIKGIVRMTMSVHGLIKPGSTPGVVDYTELSKFDMKGHLPARLLNMVIASEAQKGVKEMYKHFQDEKKK